MADGTRPPRPLFPHVRPVIGFAVAAGFTALVAGAFVARGMATPRFLAYNLPIALPFAAFFVDRWRDRRPRLGLVDILVLGLALARVVSPFPYASGHVLFLSYAACSARGWGLRWAAIVTLAGAVAYKLVVWHDVKTPLLGLAMGLLAAWAERQWSAAAAARR